VLIRAHCVIYSMIGDEEGEKASGAQGELDRSNDA
jgi:hypothetical protein